MPWLPHTEDLPEVYLLCVHVRQNNNNRNGSVREKCEIAILKGKGLTCMLNRQCNAWHQKEDMKLGSWYGNIITISAT